MIQGAQHDSIGRMAHVLTVETSRELVVVFAPLSGQISVGYADQ